MSQNHAQSRKVIPLVAANVIITVADAALNSVIAAAPYGRGAAIARLQIQIGIWVLLRLPTNLFLRRKITQQIPRTQ